MLRGEVNSSNGRFCNCLTRNKVRVHPSPNQVEVAGSSWSQRAQVIYDAIEHWAVRSGSHMRRESKFSGKDKNIQRRVFFWPNIFFRWLFWVCWTKQEQLTPGCLAISHQPLIHLRSRDPSSLQVAMIYEEVWQPIMTERFSSENLIHKISIKITVRGQCGKKVSSRISNHSSFIPFCLLQSPVYPSSSIFHLHATWWTENMWARAMTTTIWRMGTGREKVYNAAIRPLEEENNGQSTSSFLQERGASKTLKYFV